MTVDLVLIGGTGLYAMPGMEQGDTVHIETPFGAPSDAFALGRVGNLEIAFLARHGHAHDIAPHQVNYRANVWAARELGARRVLGINAVGGISDDMAPRALVSPDQLIDYTWGRESSFHTRGTVPHAEFAEPYDAGMRTSLRDAAAAAGVRVVDGGCYGATQGPRLETRAEISRMRRDGCDLVGMTGMPEAALARELGLAYASLCLVANWAAGCAAGDDGDGSITMDEVTANVEAAGSALPELLKHLQ